MAAERQALAGPGRATRRGFLQRLALVGAAMSVGPLRYLVRPLDAWAVIGPGSCPPGSACADGWTEFCCSIHQGRNTCPSYSFMGGWWKCTYYPGSRLCGEQNVRYYIDCNLKPGYSAPGGCHCAGGSCSHRRVACNVFRYGQCNTQIGGTTPVVCRVVTCVNPATIPGYNCNATLMIENAVCGQDAGCLSESHEHVIGRNPGV